VIARVCLLLTLTACDAAPCVDTDLDGYGPGCALGDDCDPNHPLRYEDCDTIPPSDCAADPVAVGCPCLPGAVSSCLDAIDGIGICTGGRTQCVNEHWGVCEGGVAPTYERCEGTDEDCDGVVDEGVVSPCGGCMRGCTGGVWGEPPVPFEEGGGFALTRLGELTLATTEQTFPVVWVPNSAEGTLSRIDATLAIETARYETSGSEPARVAVDWAGDVWVVNREFEGISTVTKIAGEPARCVDRDGDGLETSSGPGDVRPIGQDECVLFTVPIGGERGVARAIAIDGDRGLDEVSGGDAWIGLHDEEAIVELDGLTGAELTRIETPGFSPYGATFDRWGTLWMIERDGYLARVDVRADPPEVEILEAPLACFLFYGVAVDLEGRLLMTGFSCDRVVSYDPALDRWTTRTSPASPRGAAFDGERFWIAHTTSWVSEVALDPLRIVRTISAADELVTPIETIGVSVDGSGQVWSVSSRSVTGELGVATRIDPDAETVTAQVPVGLAPHVQGDLTGQSARFGLVPTASTTRVFEGCNGEGATNWLRIHVAGTPGTTGTIMIEARHAANVAALDAQSFEVLGTIPDQPAPYDLEFPDGGVIEVRLTLSVTGSIGAPRVRRVGVGWECPGPD
jgi:hypothetical protein